MWFVDIDLTLRGVRQRALISLRQLGARAHTSHAAIAAYEAGRVAPTSDTVGRIVRAAGFELEASLVRAVPGHEGRGQELFDVLELAEQFPARHHRSLQCPRFGRA
jgi:transcriptional regulator with XRE-family HTH domain